jgi:predicted DNA-binding transcriptional regulator AlpA
MQPLLTQKDAASLLSLSTRTLERLRCVGGGPRFVKMGKGSVRYSIADLEAWVASRTIANTSEAETIND